MTKRKFAPVHPGVVLAEDFLKEKNISQYGLAKGIGATPHGQNSCKLCM
jgi:plasmid maintenance system antidote protein VapI